VGGPDTLLGSAPFDFPQAPVQVLHELLLGDDAALAWCGLILFFVLRHSHHLPPSNGVPGPCLRKMRQGSDTRGRQPSVGRAGGRGLP
jgi:hypothetical protein